MVSDFFNIPAKEHTSNQLLYVGVIDNNKNLIHLLEAMHQLNQQGKRYTLNVLGDFNQTEYRQLIVDFVSQHQLEAQVFFKGWVNQQVVRQYLAQADILVVCSKHESLPMVIAESMAASKVVVASAVGGIPEMIQHGVDGFLFKLEKTEALQNILGMLHGNDKEVNTISGQARASAQQKQHSKVVAEKTMAFYQSCMNAQ
jgi:glycosyltransferase involved in cell wall biosynthesis